MQSINFISLKSIFLYFKNSLWSTRTIAIWQFLIALSEDTNLELPFSDKGSFLIFGSTINSDESKFLTTSLVISKAGLSLRSSIFALNAIPKIAIFIFDGSRFFSFEISLTAFLRFLITNFV